MLATLYEMHTGPLTGARGFWHGTLIHGRSRGILLALLCGFAVSLILTSRRLNLYTPKRLNNILHEQRLSPASLLYLGPPPRRHALSGPCRGHSSQHCADHPGARHRSLSMRRLLYRALLYRNFERGIGTRNILI